MNISPKDAKRGFYRKMRNIISVRRQEKAQEIVKDNNGKEKKILQKVKQNKVRKTETIKTMTCNI